MATFVLVHGSWTGAWCWTKIRPLLEHLGHKVIAIDLPGYGGDKTPAREVSLESYRQCVSDTIDRQTESIILVAHSMAGIAISSAAECRPYKVRALVYIAGFLLKDGQSIFDLHQTDPQSLLMKSVELSPDSAQSTVKQEAIRELFYSDCPDDIARWASNQLQPDPVAPILTPIHVTEENFGKIPLVYIECLQDKAISPELQKRMYTASPYSKVVRLNTGHSPFFSAPKRLASALASVTLTSA